MIKFLEEVIRDYIEFIQEYKFMIKAQGKDEKIFEKKRNGVIGNYIFLYHGAGCRLERDGIICEYDFLPENGYPIKFSNWKIYEFINTNKKWNVKGYSQKDIHDGLMGLVEIKKLFLLEIGGVKFPVFQIKNINDFDTVIKK